MEDDEAIPKSQSLNPAGLLRSAYNISQLVFAPHNFSKRTSARNDNFFSSFQMKTILITNGHVVDPANKINKICDVLIQDGKIKKVGKNIKVEADEVIDAKNKLVTPGLVDIQVHFREPGREDKETIETGLRAALAGGVTSVVTMPNTTPVTD